VSTTTHRHDYTITEAAALTGLPASTLRYYEQIGVIAPVGRGATSGHRVYSEDDLDQIVWVACLAATGMAIADMRQYVANGVLGPAAAGEQIELLLEQEQRLAHEAEMVAVRREYVGLKVEYWRAVQDGDTERSEALSAQARALADRLGRGKQK
jgi:DNA-binding transcriptional MerR regulator